MSNALAVRTDDTVMANVRALVITDEFNDLTYDVVVNFLQAGIVTIGDLLDYWAMMAEPEEALVLTDHDMATIRTMIREINERSGLSLVV
jgi:hypothetical protein